jgi:hypothetical protein
LSVRRFFLVISELWLSVTLSIVPTAALGTTDKTELHLSVQFTDDRLSIEAENVPRQALLEQISETGALVLEVRGQIEASDTVSVRVGSQPIRDAVSWLVGNHSYALIEGPDQDDPSSSRLTLIVFDPDWSTAAAAPPMSSDGDDDPANDGASLLIDRLASDDQEERLVAVAKAMLLPSEEAATVLEKALEHDNDRKTRSRAVAALLRLKTPQAQALLRDVAMESDDIALRIQAINALSSMLGDGSIDLLDDILAQETRNRLRLAALVSLQRINSDDARASMELALDDHDARIRRAAKRALEGKEVIPKRRRRY